MKRLHIAHIIDTLAQEQSSSQMVFESDELEEKEIKEEQARLAWLKKMSRAPFTSKMRQMYVKSKAPSVVFSDSLDKNVN